MFTVLSRGARACLWCFLLHRLGLLATRCRLVSEKDEHKQRNGEAPPHLEPVARLDVVRVGDVAGFHGQETGLDTQTEYGTELTLVTSTELLT